MHLVLLLYFMFRLLPVFLERCSLLQVLRVVFVVSVYFLIVVHVRSPLLLLSGRTTGYFAGQSTAVVEILQSSAPGQQAAPLISQRLTLFSCGAAVRVKKVEQTALACQQPQLLPTMLPTAPAATDQASDIYT